MEKMKKILGYIFGGIAVVLYIPFILVKLLVPVFVGLAYFSVPLVAIIATGFVVFRGVVVFSHQDEIFTILWLLMGICLILHMIKFVARDLKKFKKWLWIWGKKWYDNVIKPL